MTYFTICHYNKFQRMVYSKINSQIPLWRHRKLAVEFRNEFLGASHFVLETDVKRLHDYHRLMERKEENNATSSTPEN